MGHQRGGERGGEERERGEEREKEREKERERERDADLARERTSPFGSAVEACGGLYPLCPSAAGRIPADEQGSIMGGRAGANGG